MPPLVTSNKARANHGLPLLADVNGAPSRFDPLRPQRLAAPAVIYVEAFCAHPLDADVGELYAPPDGYLDADGGFDRHRRSPDGKPVYCIEISPKDGLYPLPYMALQSDGQPWETDGTGPRISRALSRQPFRPDGFRTFEEVDRFGVDGFGHGNTISNCADVGFFRLARAAGYTKGLPAASATLRPKSPARTSFPTGLLISTHRRRACRSRR